MSMQNINGFKLFLIRKGLKPSSIALHVRFIERFFDACKIEELETYLLKLVENGHKHTYINSIITSFRYYGQFTDDEKLKKIPFLKVEERNKGIMQDKEIEDFINLPPLLHHKNGKIWHYYKMRLFWMCLAYSGARTSEISTLKASCSVDFGRQVFVVSGKMGTRLIPISPVLLQPLKDHLRTLKGDYLFPSVNTERPIERATWNLDFHKRMKRLGIKRENLTPYSLRHSFITRNWRNMSLPELQKIAGHKQIQTTLSYTHLVTEDMVDAINRDRLGRKHADPKEIIKQLKNAILEKCADDPRFRFSITEDGLELLFKIEFLQKDK